MLLPTGGHVEADWCIVWVEFRVGEVNSFNCTRCRTIKLQKALIRRLQRSTHLGKINHYRWPLVKFVGNVQRLILLFRLRYQRTQNQSVIRRTLKSKSNCRKRSQWWHRRNLQITIPVRQQTYLWIYLIRNSKTICRWNRSTCINHRLPYLTVNFLSNIPCFLKIIFWYLVCFKNIYKCSKL